MAQGGISSPSYPFSGLKQVQLIKAEGADDDGEPIFPRVLVADLNTKSEFWAHLGFNDERNHTSISYGQLVKLGDIIEVKGFFSLKNFWHSYGDPSKEIPATAINESFRTWRPQVLRIWESPLTESEKKYTKASKEDIKKRRIFWVVQDSQSGGGGGSSECCYWS